MMKKHTTFELGGPAKFFIKPKSINKIIKVIRLCKEYNIEYFILGNGSNLLVSENGFDGLVINIHEDNFSDLKIEKIDKSNYKVSVGGGILMKTLAKRLCLLSLSGLEDIIDIPGTIGGGIIMNAQAYGKGIIYHSLDKVKVITPEGEIKELSKIDCQLRHRGSFLRDNKYLVIEATFNLIKIDKMIIQKTMADLTSRRYANQPMYFPNAGSFFIWDKNKFGSLYEKYKENNLVGYSVGDAMIYKNNIAFIVNFGNAKSSDVYEISTPISRGYKAFLINLSYKLNIAIGGEPIGQNLNGSFEFRHYKSANEEYKFSFNFGNDININVNNNEKVDNSNNKIIELLYNECMEKYATEEWNIFYKNNILDLIKQYANKEWPIKKEGNICDFLFEEKKEDNSNHDNKKLIENEINSEENNLNNKINDEKITPKNEENQKTE